MARVFDRASVEYLSTTTLALTATPATLAGWFYVLNLTQDHELITFTKNGTNAESIRLRASGTTSGDPVRASIRQANSEANASTSSGYPANEWFHAAGVYTSSSSRDAFVNGGSKGSNTTSKTPSGLDRHAIGAFIGSSIINPLDGRAAEVGVWNVALTDAEIAILALGVSPRFVRPASLVYYVPLIRDDDNDLVGGISMSVTGTPTIGVHPRVIYPVAPIISYSAAAVAASAPDFFGMPPTAQPVPPPPLVIGY